MNCPVCKNKIQKIKKKCFSAGALFSFLAGILLLANIFIHWLLGAAALFAFISGTLFLLLREYKKTD